MNGCGSLNNLNGLKELRYLNEISLSGCGSLKNLDELKGLKKIDGISIDHCESLENIDALKGMKGIGYGEIDLTGCGKLNHKKSLEGIKRISKLIMNDTQFENPDIISGLTQLKIIDFGSSNNSSKLKDLSCFSKLTKLVILGLKGSIELETLMAWKDV